MHLSNTRSLLLNNWRGILIEAEPGRFVSLKKTYKENPKVICVRALVDDRENSVANILSSVGVREELDFLSIDIDGEDFYSFSSLDVKPRVICVEVNAGHSPTDATLLPRDTAARNVGQPLQPFVDAGLRLGYRLVCYTGNAFFLRDDLNCVAEFPTLSSEVAYSRYLKHLDRRAKRWLFMVNKGWVNPWYRYRNQYLRASRLELSVGDVFLTCLTWLDEAIRKRARSWFPRVSAR
jgi:hypothetical protein